ncbi:helix-turn-helix domain-containing protein [Natronococcus sp.]|uniref:helix-turn-helix domain-containing protein n=1 Tax=Natronococcus sp. TaxID=35747 RepID=UPI003A4D4088
MGFVLEAELTHEDLVLGPTIEAVSETTIRYEYADARGTDRYLFVSAFGTDHETVDRAIDADHTVTDPVRIAEFPNRAIYRVTFASALDPIPEQCSESGLFVFKLTSNERGWVVRLYLPDRETLSAFRERCLERGIDFHIRQLQESNPDDETYVLTERQHEMLLLAYYAGYYDIPRRVSQGDLAERLDVSTSAVSQRLRRAVAELIATTLETNRTPERLE